ncbi:hypothetical protein GCM10010261_32730 [Streptomyces pilosus]|nr:hypothetical protein GCM10010261_32730 [Streptomyces pilosus]
MVSTASITSVASVAPDVTAVESPLSPRVLVMRFAPSATASVRWPGAAHHGAHLRPGKGTGADGTAPRGHCAHSALPVDTTSVSR